jgi:hypothetical protein
MTPVRPSGLRGRRGDAARRSMQSYWSCTLNSKGALKTNPVVAWYGSHRNGDLIFLSRKLRAESFFEEKL